MAIASNLVDKDRLPRHVAIIMDGNGRWAKKRGLPRVAGHKVGLESVRAMVKACTEFGIPYLTLYAFSSENWRRPSSEVGFLMRLLEIYLKRELKELDDNGVRINAIGRLEGLPASARRQLALSRRSTAKNSGLTLTLALNYGGRRDILDGVLLAAKAIAKGKLKAGQLNEEVFSGLLQTGKLPDPDLVIRTSGELRLSNFLLWQSAYAEVFFTSTLWPDFRKPQFIEALKDFSQRERRFGDIAPVKR
ncbi:MAG: isoprenyl transferase [candidate division FCPU426 bacterium]